MIGSHRGGARRRTQAFEMITRVNEFRANEGGGEELRELLGSFVPVIAGASGCRFCRLLQGRDDPSRLLVIEEWDSAEAHQASVTEIPPAALERAMELLAGAPTGAYFTDRTEG
jgi:quinol monooxygenase YgiN